MDSQRIEKLLREAGLRAEVLHSAPDDCPVCREVVGTDRTAA